MMDAAALQKQLSEQIAADIKQAQAVKQVPRVPGVPSSASADLLVPPRGAIRLLSFTLISAVVAGLAWAHQAVVEEVTVGEGRVIPASKIQHVQNLEGGIIREIFVASGARVKKGDLLMRIDATGADASLKEQ